MGTLRSQILDYINWFEEESYLIDLKARYSAEEIDDSLVELLAEGSSDEVASTCLFIRDLVLRTENGAEIVFKNERVRATLEDLVRSIELSKRDNAVDTLGKIGSVSSVPFLRERFELSCHSDPILLPRLAGEIQWLSGDVDYPWLRMNAIASDQFLTRWAGLGIMEDISISPSDPEWRIKYDVISSLIDDPHDKVRTTSRFLTEEMEFEARLPEIATRAEKKRRRKELERKRPRSFDLHAASFLNEVSRSGAVNYTVDEFARFVELGG